MKQKNYGLLPSHSQSIIHLMMLIVSCIALTANAQNYTMSYVDQPGIYVQNQNNETILQEYYYQGLSNPVTNSTGRTVMFRLVEDQQSGYIYTLHVSLVDMNGNYVNTSGYTTFLPLIGSNVVPVASAFNPVTEEYIVSGNADVNGVNEIWYMTFDYDLNLVNYNLITDPSGGGHLYVTDVCATTLNLDPTNTFLEYDFAFTGKRTNTQVADAWAASSISTLGSAAVFVMEHNTQTTAIDFNIINNTNGVNRFEELGYPSSIIEINSPNSQSQGYFISGTLLNRFWGPNTSDALFYIRTDYDLSLNSANTTTYSLGDFNSAFASWFNAQAAQYDPNTDAVYVAGSIFGYSPFVQGYFFDRVPIAGSSPGAVMAPSSNAWGAGQAVPYYDVQVPPINGDAYNNVDNVFSNITNGGEQKDIGVRLFLGGIDIGGGVSYNVPGMLRVDYNPATDFNAFTWPISTNNTLSTFYPRRYGNPTGVHSYGSHNPFVEGANFQQTVKSLASTSGDEIYTQATIGDPITPITQYNSVLTTSDGTNFNNSCNSVNPQLNIGAYAMTPVTPVNNVSTNISPITYSASSTYVPNLNSMAEYNCAVLNFKPNKDVTSNIKLWYADGSIRWQGDMEQLKYITLLDGSGAVIKKVDGASLYSLKYAMHDMARGLYVVQYQTLDNQISNLKVIH